MPLDADFDTLVLKDSKPSQEVRSLQIAVIDDEKDQRASLAKLIESTGVNCTIDQIDSARVLLQHIAAKRFDILFMDIDLGRDSINGVDLFDALSKKFPWMQVVYVSSHLELISRAYQTEHVFFLPKPVTLDDLSIALDRAIKASNDWAHRSLAVKIGGNVHRIDPHNILYAESLKRRVSFQMIDGSQVVFYAKISDVADMLPKEFCQCHRSFLVNLAYVNSLEQNCLILAGGKSVPLSKQRRNEVREAFLSFFANREL